MRSSLFLFALLAMAGANAAEPLGRLFFTPQQRSELDRMRENNGAPVAATARSQTITVNGLVQRSSGRDTAWINSSAREASDAAANGVVDSKARAASAVAVELPSGKNVHLKAGQTYDPASGRVSEPYENLPAAASESRPRTVQEK